MLGGLLLGLGLMLASRAATIQQFLVMFGIVGIGVGSFYAPLTATTTRWFVRHRSLAVALVSAGIGLGSTVVAPFARWAISAYDWRTALVMLGAGAWLLILPAGLLVRKPPAPAPGAATSGGEPGFTVAQALSSPQFAAIALTHSRAAWPIPGRLSHGDRRHRVRRHAACRRDSDQRRRPILGWWTRAVRPARRPLRRKETLIAGLFVQAASISLYLVVRDLSAFYALAMLFGLAYGGIMPLYATLVREYFGAAIMGTVFAPSRCSRPSAWRSGPGPAAGSTTISAVISGSISCLRDRPRCGGDRLHTSGRAGGANWLRASWHS